MGLWPVRCAPVGSVAVGSILWRHVGELRCTVVVKATFAMPETGEMTRINPQPIRRTDDYLHGLPSLAGAAEMAPRLNEAGATVIGHAYSPSPEGIKKRSVRFTIVRRNTLLVDKTLYVYGDRVKGGSPKRFTKMHIGYERALGGIDFSRNPIGVGMDKGAVARPNIIHPKDPKRAVGGFGPIPGRFPRRRRKLGDVRLEDLESGIADLPADFDWDYFQAAPRDQRIAKLRGDEWLMLEGMHPTNPRLRVRIPKARGLARVYKQKNVAAPDMLELVCDTLMVEPDHERCSLTWRGDFPLPSELAATAILVAGAVQEGDDVITWPPSIEDLDNIASPANVGKPLAPAIPGEQGLFRTALSPGVAQPAHAPRKPPPPPPRRRKTGTAPPPLPPAPVPPPPDWQKVARPSWGDFPAVSQPEGSHSEVASSAVSSGLGSVASGDLGSLAYPSYPGMPAAPHDVASQPQWAADQTTALHPPETRTSTGTIPAPPPEDEIDAVTPFDQTELMQEEAPAENRWEKTDPLVDEDDDSEFVQTRVADDD